MPVPSIMGATDSLAAAMAAMLGFDFGPMVHAPDFAAMLHILHADRGSLALRE